MEIKYSKHIETRIEEGVDVRLLTIHPLKEGQKENRIQSGRWRRI